MHRGHFDGWRIIFYIIYHWHLHVYNYMWWCAIIKSNSLITHRRSLQLDRRRSPPHSHRSSAAGSLPPVHSLMFSANYIVLLPFLFFPGSSPLIVAVTRLSPILFQCWYSLIFLRLTSSRRPWYSGSPICSLTLMFVTWSLQIIPRTCLHIHISNAPILLSFSFLRVHDSHP